VHDQERLSIEAHLERCASCRAEAEVLEKADESARALAVPPIPVGLAGAILAGIGQRQQAEPSIVSLVFGWSWATKAGAIAAALLVVLAGAGAGAGLAGSTGAQADGRMASLAEAGRDSAVEKGAVGGVILADDSLIPVGVFEVTPEDSGIALVLEEEWSEGNP
jgi:anti-sigma factor RsiW